MSLSDEEIEKLAQQNGTWLLFHSLRIFDFARAIERAATIAAMRRCAEICSVRADEFPYWNDAAGDCAKAIRAEIARLGADK